jgi:hypothetical protein
VFRLRKLQKEAVGAVVATTVEDSAAVQCVQPDVKEAAVVE